ncbi:MAG: M23 family metallopeptidase [Thermoanaerobaculia bacterium]|nr:M23 family metallopeptidase [Thermoanaerobaculia bacterium]
MTPLTIPNGRPGIHKLVFTVLGGALLALSTPPCCLSADEALSAAPDSSPAVVRPSDTASGAPAFQMSPPRAAVRPCAFKDPEDGKCYPTADAADEAWLARAVQAPAPPRAPASAPALSQHTRVALTTLADSQLPLEEDPDGEDVEDGGVLAPVDAKSQSTGSMARELLDSQKNSMWRRFVSTVKNWAVRKSDGKPVSMPEKELEALFSAGFPLPIEQFSFAKLKDTFESPRGRHKRHHAIDLGAPHGTPIVAVTDGTIERLGRDPRGGKVVYLRDTTGKFLFYYAHLAAHEPGIRPGDLVKKGQRIGFVGSTGRVIGGPHLHFAIFRVEGESNFKTGFAINPYVVFAPLIPR